MVVQLCEHKNHWIVYFKKDEFYGYMNYILVKKKAILKVILILQKKKKRERERERKEKSKDFQGSARKMA